MGLKFGSEPTTAMTKGIQPVKTWVTGAIQQKPTKYLGELQRGVIIPAIKPEKSSLCMFMKETLYDVVKMS